MLFRSERAPGRRLGVTVDHPVAVDWSIAWAGPQPYAAKFGPVNAWILPPPS